LRICDSCCRLVTAIVETQTEEESSDEDELSPFTTPRRKHRKSSASSWQSPSAHTPCSSVDYQDDIAFSVQLLERPNDVDYDNTPWGAITECHYTTHDEWMSDELSGSEEPSESAWCGRFVRSDVAKRDLVTGFVRDCWRTMLQFDGFAFPSAAVMGAVAEWLTVSDGIDEYHTALGIIHHHEALCYLRNYRSVETIERTKEWNRECYHSFGSDVWSRGARNVWKVKVSGHDENAQKTCILIGIVEADKVEQFTEHSGRRHVGSFSDEEHGGYALLTGNWRTYHEDSDQGQLFSASAEPIALSPDDVMAVEIDFTPKYGPGASSRCGTLKYALNGSSAPFRNGGVAFDQIDIDKSYRFAIGMFLRDKVALYQVV